MTSDHGGDDGWDSSAAAWIAEQGERGDYAREFVLDPVMLGRIAWRGIRLRNWHRPLSTYMTLLIDQGLVLRFFAEPAPVGGAPERIDQHRRAPYFMVMEWQKPAA